MVYSWPNSFILFALLLLLFSCRQDPFVRVIELEDMNDEQEYAATAQWTTQDSILRVFLSESIFVSEISNYDTLSEAFVWMQHGPGQSIFIFNPANNFYEAALPLPQNELMELFVEIGSTTLSATQVLPAAPEVVQFNDLENLVNDTMIFEDGKLSITIADNPVASNYYILEMEGTGVDAVRPDQGITESNFIVGSDNPIVDYNSNHKVFIKDNDFNGNEITIEFVFNSFFLTDLTQVKVRLRSISKEGYDFELSSAKILQSSSNPLAEPVILNTNIENGLGVFSVSAVFEEVFER